MTTESKTERAAHDAILTVCRRERQWMMRVAHSSSERASTPYLVLHIYETQPHKLWGSQPRVPRVIACGTSWTDVASKLGILVEKPSA